MSRKVIGLFLFASLPALGGNWSVGAGGLFADNAYRDTKINSLVIPFVSYQGTYFSFYGPFAKARYPIDKDNIVGATFTLGLQDFDPGEDSDNAQMQQLDERKRLFFVGPFYRKRTPYGDWVVNVNTDVSGRASGATQASLTYSYLYFERETLKYFVRPSVGVLWRSAKYNRHFYAVSNSESVASGFNAYAPNQTVAPVASLFASYRLTKRLYWTNIVSASYTPGTITNSPMSSGRHYNYSIITGLTFEIGDKNQRFNH